MASRLQTEFKTAMKKYDVELENDNIYHWKLAINGPADTVYADGAFLLHIKISKEYPLAKPEFTMITKIYHPNITSNGAMCLSTLDDWKATTSISQVLIELEEILRSPNIDNPLVPIIANQYKTDRTKFDLIAKEYTKKYAMP